MPRKPTQPFGNIMFKADGRVGRNIYHLSEDKVAQERAAFGMFVDLFNETDQGRRIQHFEPLAENDHDFCATVDGTTIDIQLTELSPRTYRVRPVGPNRADVGTPERWPVDHSAADVALRDVIAKKIEKNYSEIGHPLWLVVFATEPYVVRYISNGNLNITPALPPLWQFLTSARSVVFDEIWFTDLQTRPVRVWPTTDNSLPCSGRPVY